MKILIIGQNGSGKTSLAKKLSEKYQISHLELDKVWLELNIPSAHKADYETKGKIDDHLTTAIQSSIKENENWVCEGFYGFAMSPAAEAADIIIFIDIPLPTRLLNQIKRMFKKSKTEPDFNWMRGIKFTYSMIGRTYRTKELLHEFVNEYEAKTKIITSHRMVNHWLNELV